MRTALIDGDSFIFVAATSNEYEAQWSPWLWTLHANLDAAIEQFDETISALKEAAQADDVVVVLTDPSNWRKQVMPSYKAHRLKVRKPVVYQPMREYCQEKYSTYMRPGLEGDDVLGILATHPTLIAGEKVIVSIDKDLKTIPGLHMRLDDPERKTTVISLEEADRFHMIQTLTGDQVDGYPGCPGVGIVTAERLLDGGCPLVPRSKTFAKGKRANETILEWVVGDDPGTPWEIVVSAYKKAGLGEEAALMNARVARICRHTDYDFKKKEVRLWNPQSRSQQTPKTASA